MSNDKFHEVLDFAIEQEQAAVDFYEQLAQQVREQHVRDTLLEFANQERGHKAKLEAVRAGQPVQFRRPATDLKISDYLVEVPPGPELTFQGALVIAMKKEKASYRLYRDLASATDNPTERELFLLLAQEEAHHKLSFEITYDELIYQEN